MLYHHVMMVIFLLNQGDDRFFTDIEYFRSIYCFVYQYHINSIRYQNRHQNKVLNIELYKRIPWF